jgi:hypothetical protein
MTITRNNQVIFDGGYIHLIKYAVTVLLRKWRAARATDIIRVEVKL